MVSWRPTRRTDRSLALYAALLAVPVVSRAEDREPTSTSRGTGHDTVLVPGAGPLTLRFEYTAEVTQVGDTVHAVPSVEIPADLTDEFADVPQVAFRYGVPGRVEEDEVWLNDPGQRVDEGFAVTDTSGLQILVVSDRNAGVTTGVFYVVLEAAGDLEVPVYVSVVFVVDWEDGYSWEYTVGCCAYHPEEPLKVSFIDEVPGDLLAER